MELPDNVAWTTVTAERPLWVTLQDGDETIAHIDCVEAGEGDLVICINPDGTFSAGVLR